MIDIAVSPQIAIDEPNANERVTADNFTRSEVQEPLLARDGVPAVGIPRNLRIVSDYNPSASLRRGSDNSVKAMPENGSKTDRTCLKNYAPKMLWNPIWLHEAVLIGFCALFTALFIALILLYHFSKVSDGLSTQISRNKYSWRYGPTAGKFRCIASGAKSLS